MTALPPETSISELLDSYDGFLIDAYGVLVHASGAFPGALSFLESLHERNFPYVVVTNDSSRLPETAAAKYQQFDLPVAAERVLTSGALIDPYFEAHDLEGARCVVLGTDDSRAYVRRAGGELVDVRESEFDVLVLGDDAGFTFREAMDTTLTRLIHRFDADRPPELILPNPDLMYQQGPDTFGFAVGSMAGMFERVLGERFPSRTPTFARLGKPHEPIYEQACRQLGTDNVAMLGDQLATDIAGANRAGIDSVLVAGGVTNLETALADADVRPDFILHSLDETT
jgi:4-nitrophenyl phosphatase